MTKTELIASVAEKTGFTKKDSEKSISALLESITEALKEGEKVALIGFGTFEVRHRSARDAKNPSTGETIRIPETKVPAFKPGKALKDSVK